MPNETIIATILRLLARHDYTPVELLAELRQEGYSLADAKEAMSHLVHGHRVELTPDRRLRTPELVA